MVYPHGSDGKESLQCRRPSFDPFFGKTHWRREWQPTLVFLPGEFRGQRSLATYSLWGRKELDLIEWLTLAFKELMTLDISLKRYWRSNNKLPKISWLSPQAETCLTYHSFLYYDGEYTQMKRHRLAKYLSKSPYVLWHTHTTRGMLPNTAPKTLSTQEYRFLILTITFIYMMNYH